MNTDEKDLDALEDEQMTGPAEIVVLVDREFGAYVEGGE